jgi:mitochondrial chaperone BCS1
MVSPLLIYTFKLPTYLLEGVASHEGRVLVMTTNRPEELDEALVRPGRIDHKVEFNNATQSQARELFERMYAIELTQTRPQASSGSLTNESAQPAAPAVGTPTIAPNGALNATTNGKPPCVTFSGEELKRLASQFSEEILDCMFSPAELQGFLLKHKSDPYEACKDSKIWVKGMLEVKKAGQKTLAHVSVGNVMA